MTTGRMLEQEIARTDALSAQLERLYAYLESTCPPDFVVEAKRAAEGHLGADVSGDTPGQLQGVARSIKGSQVTQPEGGAREVVIRECWDAINAQIKEGNLPGNGWDESARRNGLIIAANILAGKLGWPTAKYAEELPTPQKAGG